jgi:hypothetical protein
VIKYNKKMTSKYHTRKGYEELFLRLCKESKDKKEYNLNLFSDYMLLSAIDRKLLRLNCVSFSEQELRCKLH